MKANPCSATGVDGKERLNVLLGVAGTEEDDDPSAALNLALIDELADNSPIVLTDGVDDLREGNIGGSG